MGHDCVPTIDMVYPGMFQCMPNRYVSHSVHVSLCIPMYPTMYPIVTKCFPVYPSLHAGIPATWKKRAARRMGRGRERTLSLSPIFSRLASLRRSFRVAGTPACRLCVSQCISMYFYVSLCIPKGVCLLCITSMNFLTYSPVFSCIPLYSYIFPCIFLCIPHH